MLWTATAGLMVAAAGLLYRWSEQHYDDRLAALIPARQRPESWMVDRPAEVNQIVRALRTGSPGATVGITTAVHGAGGPAGPRRPAGAAPVRQPGVLGDPGPRRPPRLVGRAGERAGPADRSAARAAVRGCAAGRRPSRGGTGRRARRLVVLDDVWFDEQVAAFPVRAAPSGSGDAVVGASQPRSAEGRIDAHEIIFAPDGSRFVARTETGSVRIHDAANGEPCAELPGCEVRRGALAVAPDSRWLATADEIGLVRIWDLATGKLHAKMAGYTRRAVRLAFSPDGNEIAVHESNGRTRLWSVRARTESFRHATWTDTDGRPFGDPRDGVPSPDGSWLAAASGRVIRIWAAGASEVAAVMRVDHDVWSCIWTPSGDALVVSGSAGLYRFAFRRPGRRVPHPRDPAGHLRAR